MMVPDKINFVLDALRISGMSCWWTLYSQLKSRKSARPTLGHVPLSKAQVLRHMGEEIYSIDPVPLSFLRVNSGVWPVSGNVRIFLYGAFIRFVKVFSIVLSSVNCAACSIFFPLFKGTCTSSFLLISALIFYYLSF